MDLLNRNKHKLRSVLQYEGRCRRGSNEISSERLSHFQSKGQMEMANQDNPNQSKGEVR